MKEAYPVVITRSDGAFLVYIPDFDLSTEGTNIADAIAMARDAIGIAGIDKQDDGLPLPSASAMADIMIGAPQDSMVTLVDIDFTAYRRMNDQRAVKKNCTVPAWLCYEAEKAGINFSAVLQKALRRELHIGDDA